MAEPKKKNIFTNIANALSNKDEKAEAEAAAKAAADKAAAAAKASAEKIKADVARAAAAAEAKAAADKAAADKVKAAAAAEEARKEQARASMEAMAKKAEETRKATEEKLAAMAAKPKFIAEHKVKDGETLSHLSLKYYGSAARPFWMLIYEANKETIGANPSIIRTGMDLNIPELPQELKDELKK